MYCEKCGTEIDDTQTFCTGCGCAVHTGQDVKAAPSKGKKTALTILTVLFIIGAAAFALGYVTSNNAANAAYDAAEAALRSAESARNMADFYSIGSDEKIEYLERAKNSSAAAVNYKLSAYNHSNTAKKYAYLCVADAVCLIVTVALNARSGNAAAAGVKNKKGE